MKLVVATRGVVPLGPGSGGAELVAFQLARTMARVGHEVVLVTDVKDGPAFASPRLSIVPVESRFQRWVKKLPGGFFRWLLEHFVGNLTVSLTVRRLLRSGTEADVIHTHGSLETILISRFTSVPIVYTEHDATPWSCRYRHWYERRIRKLVYRLMNVAAFRRASHVATISESLRAELIDRWQIPPDRVTTIMNGTDVDIFNPRRPGADLVRERSGFDRYCLFVGQLTSRKGPDLLLRALADTDDICCVLVGDGPMRSNLEALAKKLGLESRVTFLGSVPQEQLGRIYAEADVLVLPSVSEGTPLVVLESMACGTPVVTTRVSGLPSLVRDWETGFLLKPGDVGQLTMALRFVTGDERLRRRMGAKAQTLVRRKFVWPNVAKQYLDVYEALSSSPRRALTAVEHEESDAFAEAAG